MKMCVKKKGNIKLWQYKRVCDSVSANAAFIYFAAKRTIIQYCITKKKTMYALTQIIT